MLNVKHIVDTIRLYRPHLVQTLVCTNFIFDKKRLKKSHFLFKEQYEYIYRCLAELAIHPCVGQALNNFIDYCRILLPTVNLKDNTISYDFQVNLIFFEKNFQRFS